MGLDIYAGTLTRYYAQNWKTVNQQWAEEHGWGFQRITPGGEPLAGEGQAPPAEVQKDMENWRDQLLTALAQPGREPYAPWPEDSEKPYYTDKPDWDAFGAMLLTAACHTYGEPVPSTVQKDWKFTEHPVIKRLTEDRERVWSLFRGADWWIPLSDGFLFQAYLPNGARAVVATVGALRGELERLNALAWQADEDTILGWSRTEGYPAGVEVGPGGVLAEPDGREHTEYNTESLAKFSFSIFWRALRFAEENRVPVLMDY